MSGRRAAPVVAMWSVGRSRCAFVSLLHGESQEYLAYALVLGRRLRQECPGVDRVLLLGPGQWRSRAARAALAWAGWSYVWAVHPIRAGHLDKSGRHGLVFTKLRALEVPYERIVLLDLDLLPRCGSDLRSLFAVGAPAGKYFGEYQGRHGDLIGPEARRPFWCPNTGVLRLDPRPTRWARRAQVAGLVGRLSSPAAVRACYSYLPDQYFLAWVWGGWRHIHECYNYEVAIGVGDAWQGPPISVPDVLRATRVWHFSGKCGLQPYMFCDLDDAADVCAWLGRHCGDQDPEGLIARAFAEWAGAWGELLCDAAVPSLVRGIHHTLRSRARAARETIVHWRAGRWGS